jgi:thioesterase domain-containing protein
MAARTERVPSRAVRAVSPEQGLALFEAALGSAEPVLAPLPLDRSPGAVAAGTPVPPPLRGLLRPARPTASSTSGDEETGPGEAAGAWRARLAALSEPERLPALRELIRAEVAAVLGHTDVGAVDRAFPELGFDSLTSVLLRNRLTLLTGIPLAATVVHDCPGVPELADHMYAELSGGTTSAAGNEDADAARTALPRSAVSPDPRGDRRPRSGQSLPALYRKVCSTGDVVSAMHLLVTASLGAPSFGADDIPRQAQAPLRPATGPQGPAIVCVPGFATNLGRPWHAGLAACFEGERDVFELQHPGVDHGDAVARDLSTLVQLHATTVRHHLGDRPYVIVGHSMGGSAAHAVAARLAADGAPPAGLVLLDAYRITPDRETESWLLALPARMPMAMGERFDTAVDDLTLLSLGAYTRMFRGWRPEPLPVRTLLVRATQPLPNMPERWRSAWPGADDTVDVPGSHLSMLEEHRATTAEAIRVWVGSPGPRTA